MMHSSKKWADLRILIEKGFELSGTPIATLEPKEERLWFVKKAKKSKYSKKSRRYKKPRASQKGAKVILGDTTSLSTKPKTVIKRKSSSKGGS